MKDLLNKVTEFQTAFKRTVNTSPTLINKTKGKLRYDLMKEENKEYYNAVHDENLIDIADALGDMLYVLCGTIIEHGLQDKIEAVFNEIHESNMSKLDSNGEPIINGENGFFDRTKPKGKVIKGENYFKPNLKDILWNI